MSESCDAEAICDSDIGRVSTANSHGAAAPAQTMATAPTAIEAMPVSSREVTSVCNTVIRVARPMRMPSADGA